jgi:phosphatidylinositol alpha-1,6-mannosyltransferase
MAKELGGTSHKKLLMVTRNFPPLTGGMERLNHHVFKALQHDFEVTLCAPRGAEAYADGRPCFTFSAAPAWRYSLESLWSAIKAAIKTRPDMIYAGSGLAAPAVLAASRLTGARNVVFLHGLDLIADNFFYQRFFLPAIKKCDFFFVNSGHTANLASQNGIDRERIQIIHPGVELPDIAAKPVASQQFRTRFQLGSRPLLLSAGRLSPRKGVIEFITHCMPEIVAAIPDACLIIIGDAPTQGLAASSTDIKQGIHQAVTDLHLEDHVRLLGRCDDSTLSEAYFAADAFVFPVIESPNDVEGFGMVAVEAAAHGTPTIAFACGGIPDAIADGVSGDLIDSGNYGLLIEKILDRLTAKPSISEKCRQHAEKFAWSNFNSQIIGAIQRAANSSAKQ